MYNLSVIRQHVNDNATGEEVEQQSSIVDNDLFQQYNAFDEDVDDEEDYSDMVDELQ